MGWRGGLRRERSAIAPVNCCCAGADVAAGGDFEAIADGAISCLDCLTSQALSSKPVSTCFSTGGCGDDGVSVGLDASTSFCSNAFGSTASPAWTVGAGRPLRVLFRNMPPGPEKSPEDPPCSPLPMTSSPPKLTFLNFDLDPVRLNMLSR